MFISWIGVMLCFLLMLLFLSDVVHGKAFLEDSYNEGKPNYYSEVRNRYQPVYDQSYAANPKLFYTPQIDGQPIYIPAISGSEHVNKFLDDYYKINRDYTQSWTLAPPVTYDLYTSESSYYENGATANSMVKNFLEEKYKDGAYSSYILPSTPGNVPEQEIKNTDHKGIEHKDPSNKKTHNRKKKRPHGVSTESSYFMQYKIKTDVPDDFSTVLIKTNYKKQGDKSPELAKSGVDDRDLDEISTFELKEDKTKSNKPIKNGMDYSKGIKIKDEKSNKKDKKRPGKHNKSKTKPASKSPDLKFSKKEKTTETLEYSTKKINSQVSTGKNKPEVDSIDEFSEDDYEPEIVDVINEDDYEPEVVDVNKLSNGEYQQDVDVIKIPQTKKHLDAEDYDKSTNRNFPSKDKNKKDKNKIKNTSVYSEVKKDKPKVIHQSVKINNKPDKHIVKDSTTDDIKLYNLKNTKNPKGNSKKDKDKMFDSYEQDASNKVNTLSDDDYELEAVDELSDDYDPEVVDVVNELSDDLKTEDEDTTELLDFDLDPEVDKIVEKNLEMPKTDTHSGNDETAILDIFSSKKGEAKPNKPVKAKPNKPVKAKDHDKNVDKYKDSEIKSTSLKEIQPPKIEIKDESEQKYKSDGHIMKGDDEDALIDESVIENQTDLQEMHSRDLLNQPTDIPKEVDEFDGSGSQAMDTSMRRIPQFFKNVESIRNLTSLNSNIWSLIFNPNAERNELKKCVTRSNETGICMYVQQCEVPNIATSLEQLLNNACVIDDMFIGVCCPEFPVQTVKVHWDEMPSNSDKQSEDEFGHSADDCGMRSDDAKKAESWPWQAPLVSMSNGKIFCGGVIINDDYILTAAHCTTKIPKNQILVRLGQHDETSGDDFAVVEIKRHAQYNPRTLHNDIALLKLGKRIVRDKHTDAVCLPEDDDDDDHEDEKAMLLGRKGRFSKSSKQTEWLKVMSNEDCEKKLGSKVPATLLCTEARDENERTCNLDSGAPLVVEDDDKYEVIGILSWNRKDCDERFPSTFSRVSKYVRWIQKHAV